MSLKTSYRASPASLRPTYTGGPVALTPDGLYLVTTLHSASLYITHIASSRVVAQIKGDATPITAVAVAPDPTGDAEYVVLTAHQSLSVRYYPFSTTDAAEFLATTTTVDHAPFLTFTRQLTRAQTHPSPILSLEVSPAVPGTPGATLFATGSADGTVKVWDTKGGFVTHVFRGHGGGVSAFAWRFHHSSAAPQTTTGYANAPTHDGRIMQLITGSVDTRVRVYDLLDRSASGRPIHVLEGHVSVVRGLDVSPDARWLISAGRDRVVLVWDLLPHSTDKKLGAPRVVQTLLANESLETVGFVFPVHGIAGVELEDRSVCYTGGERGRVRLWDVLRGKEVAVVPGLEVDEEPEEDEQRGLAYVFYNPDTASTVAVHHDQNIVVASLPKLAVTRQIIGFNDEVIDSIYLASDTYLALATNSNLIRMYDTQSMDARLLSGHADVVLCLDKSPDGEWLVSGSKDNTARIWTRLAGEWRCVAVAQGHAESIGAVAMSRTGAGRARFLFTASQDRTVKMWDLSELVVPADEGDEGDPIKLKSLATMRIHEKDINSLDVSPNDGLLVSGSQDKTLKVFSITYRAGTTNAPASGGIKQLGVCKGHKRGVWSVRFSPTDKAVVSGAADRTVRLWSLDDFTCLKTFEGHTNSVLRVGFLSNGMQLVSTASDGLVKLWNIREEECVKTLDGHEDKIWALAISSDEKTIVSGGADSVVTLWQDCSVEEQQEESAKLEKQVADEQDYQNYVSLKDYKRAIQLALAMAQPGRLLNLFNRVYESRHLAAEDAKSITGSAAVDEILRTLPPKDLVRLLKFVRDWNTRAKTSGVAQRILETIVRGKSPNDLMRTFEVASAKPAAVEEETEVDPADPPKRHRATTADLITLQDLLDGLLPYTERHLNRIERTLVDSYMVDYILGEMDGGLFDLGSLEVDEVSDALEEDMDV